MYLPLLCPFCVPSYSFLCFWLSVLFATCFSVPFLPARLLFCFAFSSLSLLFHTSCSSFNISFLHIILYCCPLIVCHLNNPAWERLFSVSLLYSVFPFLSFHCLSSYFRYATARDVAYTRTTNHATLTANKTTGT